MAMPRVPIAYPYQSDPKSYRDYDWPALEKVTGKRWNDQQRREIFWLRSNYFYYIFQYHRAPSVSSVHSLEDSILRVANQVCEQAARTHKYRARDVSPQAVDEEAFRVLDHSTGIIGGYPVPLPEHEAKLSPFEREYLRMVTAAAELLAILDDERRSAYHVEDVRKPERLALASCHEFAKSTTASGEKLAERWGFNPSPKSKPYRTFLSNLFEREKEINEDAMKKLDGVEAVIRDPGPQQMAVVFMEVAKMT